MKLSSLQVQCRVISGFLRAGSFSCAVFLSGGSLPEANVEGAALQENQGSVPLFDAVEEAGNVNS